MTGEGGGGLDRDDASGYLPSPVPSDARLWPGELPFTAFGQFGVDALDLRVFDQDLYWVDRLGRPHLLDAMDLAYVRNVIEFLYELRVQYFVGCMNRAVIQELGDAILFGGPGGEWLAACVGGPSWADLSPEEWLEATPLMRGLRRRASRRCE